MAQYISKSALVAEIEKKLQDLIVCKENTSFIEHKVVLSAKTDMCKEILSFIDTLEVKEVDLEKEIEEVKHNYKVDDNRHTSICSADIEWLAKHFFELGLRCKSSYVKLPSIDDTLKEMGVAIDSKIAKSFKESYFMALEKFKEKEHK